MNLYHNCVVINITQILGGGSIVGLYICYHNCSYLSFILFTFHGV